MALRISRDIYTISGLSSLSNPSFILLFPPLFISFEGNLATPVVQTKHFPCKEKGEKIGKQLI